MEFLGQKADFSSKKRTNLREIKKRSAIRPRSDKADLLGSTATVGWVKKFVSFAAWSEARIAL